MPQGVKRDLSPAEKHLLRCKENKKKLKENDPEFAKKCKDYNTEYFRNLEQPDKPKGPKRSLRQIFNEKQYFDNNLILLIFLFLILYIKMIWTLNINGY